MRAEYARRKVDSLDKRKGFRSAAVHCAPGIALLTVLAAALTLGGCTSCPQSGSSPARTVARQLARSGASSVIVFVSDHGHSTTATAGTHRPTADQRFRIGSVTKTFTAALVLKLAEQKKIRLDDPVSHYLPGVIPAGGEITIRELLQHRSGLANYTDYLSWMDEAEQSPSIRPIDVLRFAASRPLLFTPGSHWAYSNTNYIALGLVIEKVTGHPFSQVLRQRIFKPLALRRTELAATQRPPGLDDPGTNPNLAWAAGGMVSDVQDLARFFTALLSGHVISRASLANMKQTVAAGPSEDGLGIFATTLPCGRFWGHQGSILDYGTSVEASDNGARVSVISERGPIRQPPDEAALLCPA